MRKIRPKTSADQAEIEALNQECKAYIEGLKTVWLRENNHMPKGNVLYELDEGERRRVDGVITAWGRYITPLAEEWWRKRGFGIRWPEKSYGPCQIYKLEAAPV